MTERNKLVQAIAVAPGTHEETIAAVAIAASVAALQRELGDSWEEWFSRAFTKTVRRIKKPGQEERVRNDPAMRSPVTVGAARAYAYAPMSYDDFPKHLRTLQVSGLDIEPSAVGTWGDAGPLVIVSRDVPMSTGKTAAQVAHALMLWTQDLGDESTAAWLSDPTVRIRVDNLDVLDADTAFTITDSGLTEIDPGTNTVRILRGPSALL